MNGNIVTPFKNITWFIGLDLVSRYDLVYGHMSNTDSRQSLCAIFDCFRPAATNVLIMLTTMISPHLLMYHIVQSR